LVAGGLTTLAYLTERLAAEVAPAGSLRPSRVHHLAVPILSPLNPAEVVRAVRRGALSATARLGPDHRAIAMRAVRFSPDNAIRLYLYVVVAPNRFAPRTLDDGQVRRAQWFVDEAFPGVSNPLRELRMSHRRCSRSRAMTVIASTSCMCIARG
jgi:hypothetical protein